MRALGTAFAQRPLRRAERNAGGQAGQVVSSAGWGVVRGVGVEDPDRADGSDAGCAGAPAVAGRHPQGVMSPGGRHITCSRRYEPRSTMAIVDEGARDHPPGEMVDDDENESSAGTRIASRRSATACSRSRSLSWFWTYMSRLPRSPQQGAGERVAVLPRLRHELSHGRVWIAHHRACRGLRFFDSMMMRLNLLVLMTTGFLPFPTAILAEAAARSGAHRGDSGIPVWGHCARHRSGAPGIRAPGEVTTSDGPETAIAARPLWHRWWLTPSLVGYLIAIGVGLVGFPKVGAVLYLLLAIPGVLLIEVHRRPLRSNAPA